MEITATAVSINVADVAASANFAREHFGYSEAMAADGFASLTHPQAPALIFLDENSPVLPEALRTRAAGVIVAFTVGDIDAEYARLAGVGDLVVPLKTEEWGERLFVIADPNGVHYEFVSWVSG
ncbi:glyoxalase [Actinorhabdospora filicis]|uniref:Glyoxalase n=1 Tax=Actinorhabdospora filicis TaxID=1785913 RepID=A0A9W6W5Z1_9ACTN|nr:VOC family protein [Actinorhabdospora filicis]GLZ80932.1 glyoxalase [Actinorhabdospora filicis]